MFLLTPFPYILKPFIRTATTIITVVNVTTNLDFFLFSLRLLTSFSDISLWSIRTVINEVITVTFEITPKKKIIPLIEEKNSVCIIGLLPSLSK